jgi:uncharacterized membrane protein YoaK (UPF0700 family)
MTGNLRIAVDGLYDASDPAKRQASLRKFRELSLIVTAFLLGATASATLLSRFYNYTLWLIDLPHQIVPTGSFTCAKILSSSQRCHCPIHRSRQHYCSESFLRFV